jgi:putative oxidoreductase
MTLALAALPLAAVGPGTWSLDHAFDIDGDLTGGSGLAITTGAGIGGALLLLAVAWRPPRPAAHAS